MQMFKNLKKLIVIALILYVNPGFIELEYIFHLWTYLANVIESTDGEAVKISSLYQKIRWAW